MASDDIPLFPMLTPTVMNTNNDQYTCLAQFSYWPFSLPACSFIVKFTVDSYFQIPVDCFDKDLNVKLRYLR